MSNKERIANLEENVGAVQDEMERISGSLADRFQAMDVHVTDRIRGLEQMMPQQLHQILEAVASNRDTGSTAPRTGRRTETHTAGTATRGDENPFAAPASSRNAKLEFPKFNGGDPTAWVSKAKQYFAYQEMPLHQRVSFASYHLEEEANKWWQATAKSLEKESLTVTWAVFEAELWARFGPTDAEDFDEALSKIRQEGTLRDYQREFERLQNKVEGWTQKALVGTFMGGLSSNIAEGIRMFRPKTLKEAIELARMRDEQVQRNRRFNAMESRGSRADASFSSPQPPLAREDSKTTDKQPKRLSWDDMKAKRSLGLCFSCDERYTPGHRCRKAQLLLMEGEEEDDPFEEEPKP